MSGKRYIHMGEEDGAGRLWPKCGAYKAKFITTPFIPILADCPDCLRETKIEIKAKYGKLGGK